MVSALLASGPRLRRVLEAPSFEDGDVRAVRCATDAGPLVACLHLRRPAGRCAELASRAVRAVDDRVERLVLVGGQILAPAALAGESRTPALVLMMLLYAGVTALITANGSVAALVPVVVMAVRL
jgi:hypothetical protein